MTASGDLQVVESSWHSLELTDDELDRLRRLGQTLASNSSWWGSDSDEARDEATRRAAQARGTIMDWFEQEERGYALTGDGAFCSRHFEGDPPLEADQSVGNCLLCSEPSAPFYTQEDVYGWVTNEMRAHYDKAADVLMWDSEEKEWFGPTLDTDEVIDDLDLPVKPVLSQRLKEDFERTQWVSVFAFDDVIRFDELMGDAWDNFCARIKHHSRFFLSFTARPDEPTSSLVAPSVPEGYEVEAIVDSMQEAGLIVPREKGTVFFRARTFFDAPYEEAGQVASAPRAFASQGRMNAAGISTFYGAVDPRTAAAEVFDRSPFVSIGHFVTLRDLHLLDLGHEVADLVDSDVAAWIARFRQEISRPVKNETRHYDYAPTQAFTEYVRFKTAADGILFPSAVNGRQNVVLFVDHEECLNDAEWATIGGASASIRFRPQILNCAKITHHKYRDPPLEDYVPPLDF